MGLLISEQAGSAGVSVDAHPYGPATATAVTRPACQVRSCTRTRSHRHSGSTMPGQRGCRTGPAVHMSRRFRLHDWILQLPEEFSHVAIWVLHLENHRAVNGMKVARYWTEDPVRASTVVLRRRSFGSVRCDHSRRPDINFCGTLVLIGALSSSSLILRLKQIGAKRWKIRGWRKSARRGASLTT
jgi:hypothetical protein